MPDAVPQGEQIQVDLDPAATLDAYARHRRRFASEVAALDDEALGTQSRCSEWTIADVLRHCADVDEWMRALWSGGRPPFDSFDPVTTPHEFVVARRSISDAEARDRYVRSSEVMAADMDGTSPERWAITSVSPLGFVPWWLSALHVFYDSWLHERDVLLPLGRTPPIEPDEAAPVLTYSLALVGTLISEPMDVVIAGVSVRTGAAPVVATPPAAFEVTAGTATITDALSGRGRLGDALRGYDAGVVERFGALARLFGVTEEMARSGTP